MWDLALPRLSTPPGEMALQVEVGTVDLVLAVDALPRGVALVASEVISTIREVAVVSNHYPDRERAKLSVVR